MKRRRSCDAESDTQQDLVKLITRFDGKGYISVYLALFEIQIFLMIVFEGDYLLSLLPLENVNILVMEFAGPREIFSLGHVPVMDVEDDPYVHILIVFRNKFPLLHQ